MTDYKIVQQVNRRPKPMTGVLKVVMTGFAVFFVIIGVVVHQGFMLPGFLLAALYFLFDILSQRDYEYTLDDQVFSVDVILGKRYRRAAHMIHLSEIETVAPSRHPAVARYRRDGGGEKLPKYDYTSYDEDVPYYTMIAGENRNKIKLLLDLNSQMLQAMKRQYPEKIYIE